MMKKLALAFAGLIAISHMAFAQGIPPAYGPGPVPCGGVPCTVANLTVTSSAVPVNGIYLSNTNAVGFTAASALVMQYNLNALVSNSVSASWRLPFLAASSTVPTLVPNNSATTTGIGAQAAGNISFIIAGAEVWRQTSTGPLAIVLPTDGGTTDNTMCVNTTTHVISSGSGTLGICLGTSSARWKTQIAALTPGLAEILKLKSKSFYLDKAHGDPKKQMYGFIAEDMVKVLPKLVGMDKYGRPNTADYLGVVPVLVNALQQENAQVILLKRENENLRVANDNFNRRLSALEHPKLRKVALK